MSNFNISEHQPTHETLLILEMPYLSLLHQLNNDPSWLKVTNLLGRVSLQKRKISEIVAASLVPASTINMIYNNATENTLKGMQYEGI